MSTAIPSALGTQFLNVNPNHATGAVFAMQLLKIGISDAETYA